MPLLGYGLFQVPPQEAERCTSDALETGYGLPRFRRSQLSLPIVRMREPESLRISTLPDTIFRIFISLCFYVSLLYFCAGEGVGVADAEDIDLSVIDDFAAGRIIIGYLVEGLFISRRDNNLLGHTGSCLTRLTLFRAIDTVLAFMAYRERDILRLALPEKTVLAESVGRVLTQISCLLA